MKLCDGRGNPAPTLTFRTYGAFETIRSLFIFVKVGARFPRPNFDGMFSDNLLNHWTQRSKKN